MKLMILKELIQSLLKKTEKNTLFRHFKCKNSFYICNAWGQKLAKSESSPI